MAILKIYTYPEEVLKKVAKPVQKVAIKLVNKSTAKAPAKSATQQKPLKQLAKNLTMSNMGGDYTNMNNRILSYKYAVAVFPRPLWAGAGGGAK